MSVRILEGDALTVLRTLPDKSVQMCVTSPPYWGLRDYGVAGQLGLERTPDAYVAAMVAVFGEVRRVLRDDGTLWLNIGDSYCASPKGSLNGQDKSGLTSTRTQENSPVGISKLPSRIGSSPKSGQGNADVVDAPHRGKLAGFKPKDLIGIPWMLAFALRADGWYLRSDIIWHKPNPMPESVTDRPTKAHEYLFLLSKSPTYYYDADVIAEDALFAEDLRAGAGRIAYGGKRNGIAGTGQESFVSIKAKRNRRSVWTVNTSPYSEAHFATFPPKLIEPCVLAGSAKGQTVLDPFGGAGTTGLVADRLGRDALLIELNPKYAEMARRRISSDNPLFTDVA